MDTINQYLDPSASYFQTMIILAGLLVGLFLLPIITRKMTVSSDNLFVYAFVKAFPKPAYALLWSLLVWFSLLAVHDMSQMDIRIQDWPVALFLLFFHLTWYGFSVVNKFEQATLSKSDTGRLDRTAIIGVAKIVRLLIFVVLAITLFDLLGLDPSGLIALGSVSGAALAFASKDLVANWFGGIMLYLDKPFKVGDWIRSPDREIEGVVEYIGWRISIIRTFDKRPLYVPNSMFNNITVQNPSRMTHRRFKHTVSVRYEDMNRVAGLVKAIELYLKSSPLIAQDQTVIVNLTAFNAFSVDILVYCMTVETDWIEFQHQQQTLLLDIASIVDEQGCEFAFPTQTLHVQPAINA